MRKKKNNVHIGKKELRLESSWEVTRDWLENGSLDHWMKSMLPFYHILGKSTMYVGVLKTVKLDLIPRTHIGSNT